MGGVGCKSLRGGEEEDGGAELEVGEGERGRETGVGEVFGRADFGEGGGGGGLDVGPGLVRDCVEEGDVVGDVSYAAAPEEFGVFLVPGEGLVDLFGDASGVDEGLC